MILQIKTQPRYNFDISFDNTLAMFQIGSDFRS